MLNAHHTWNRSYKPLIWGFLLSIVLTLAAYFIAYEHELGGLILGWVILGLAGIQAVIQLVCFVHLGVESHPNWNLIIFLFMVLVIIVVIGGSLWIMSNLNYNVMPKMGH